VGVLGELLSVPDWARKVSPFEHVPRLPGDPLTVVPLLVLSALAAALTLAGLVGLRRRDIG
jgi:ABC-2 type transport system permease protein